MRFLQTCHSSPAVEAQGRGSLHPHILVWLVCGHLEVLSQLTEMLRTNQAELQKRLKEFMQVAVASFEAISHASVQAAPRCLGSADLDKPVKVKEVARNLCKYDGGTDVDLLRELPERTPEQEEYLAVVSEEDWRRPHVEVEVEATGQPSIFATPINQLSVAATPKYRLRPLLCDSSVPELDAHAWREAFQQDLHTLMPSLLRHVCTESCFKYSDASSATFKICRHGFYHVVHVFDGCRVRRKGKALRPCLHIGGEEEGLYGMEGRLRPIQLSPFECQTCYGGTVSGRHNLDLQDMRRVVSPSLWLDADDHLPHVGGVSSLGYMALYEWTGSAYALRGEAPTGPVSWIGRRCLAKDFRAGWRRAYRLKFGSTEAGEDDKGSAEAFEMQEGDSMASNVVDGLAASVDTSLAQAIRVSVNEAFCDGINTGFYVNNYTTKPGPGLASMLEELQKGIARLEEENKEREEARKAAEEAAHAAGEHLPGRRNKVFADTLRTLTRLTSAYRRCHWKSAAEVIFPLLFQHLTFASHRTWKLYVKKAVFFAVEAWRRQYGHSVLQHVVDKGDAAEPVIFSRPGVDDLVLKGWKRVRRVDPETGAVDEIFVGPNGQACLDIVTAFDEYQGEQQSRRKPQQQLSYVQELLKLHAVTEEVVPNETDASIVTNLQSLQATGEELAVKTTSTVEAKALAVTTSSLEDYLFRGTHPLLAGRGLINIDHLNLSSSFSLSFPSIVHVVSSFMLLPISKQGLLVHVVSDFETDPFKYEFEYECCWRVCHACLIPGGMSWATYGTWVYRIELPPRPEISVRSSVARFVDLYFDPSYKLYNSHAQRICSEPRVPMFEGFTMPPLTHDSERNAMYKQVQCRPVAVQVGENVQHTMEELVLDAFKTFSAPLAAGEAVDKSMQAHTAFTRSYLDWAAVMEEESQMARYRFAERFEFPSLWETQEMTDLLEEKLEMMSGGDLPTTQPDFDVGKPRCTVSMYSSLLSQQRIANLEGLARARQSKPKRRRDEDARLHEEYVKMHTAGEGDGDGPGLDNDEEVEALLEQAVATKEVFPPITLKTTVEEQKKLLRFELQGRRNDYVKKFLQEAWMKDDPFEAASLCRNSEHQANKQLLADLAALNQDRLFFWGGFSAFSIGSESTYKAYSLSLGYPRKFTRVLFGCAPAWFKDSSARMNAPMCMEVYERILLKMWKLRMQTGSERRC